MPGFLVHFGATVTCAHAGQAQPVATSPRVSLNGMPAVTLADSYVIAGCPFVTPSGNGPCVTAQWVLAATRITSEGQPLVLLDSQAICAPTATPLLILSTQTRVTGI
jgi:hypothetical protein